MEKKGKKCPVIAHHMDKHRKCWFHSPRAGMVSDLRLCSCLTPLPPGYLVVPEQSGKPCPGRCLRDAPGDSKVVVYALQQLAVKEGEEQEAGRCRVWGAGEADHRPRGGLCAECGGHSVARTVVCQPPSFTYLNLSILLTYEVFRICYRGSQHYVLSDMTL